MREKVIVKTLTGDLQGELFVGADGLPELVLDSQLESESLRPATFPAAWGPIVNANDERLDGPLLEAWCEIGRIRQQIRDAQREAEETNKEGRCHGGDCRFGHVIAETNGIEIADNARDRAQQREQENRLAQELDERRADENLRYDRAR